MENLFIQKLENLESNVLDSLKDHESSILKGVRRQEAQSAIVDTSSHSGEYKDGDFWHNWAGNVSFKPDKIFYPKSVEDLKTYVKDAQKNGKKIRCAAEGHTWSSLSETNDYLVILNKLDKIDIEKRSDGYVVHAGAGAQISQIDQALEKNDPPLTITSMTVLDNVRIGGVVATGCHGAKFEARTIVDQVVGFQIVTGDGELREFSDEINRDEMNAARVSLGLLGIIYRVTLRVEPMYDLRMTDTYPLKSEFNSATLRDLVKNSDGIEIFYWPFNTLGDDHSLSMETEKLWIKRWTKSSDPVTLSELQQVFQRIAQNASTKIANDFYHEILNFPNWTPFIANLAGKVKLVDHNEVWKAPGAIHYQAGIDNIPCEDLEFAIKADKDFENVITEINYVFDRIFYYAKQEKFPINLVVELRITKSSTALLSDAYDDDPDAYYFFLEILSIRGTPLFKDFSIELAKRWMEKYNARPHWAKYWEYIPNITEYLHEKLGDRLGKFEAIRAKYDPNNIFFDNESLKRVFYGTK
ncbi:hypothetical protein RclHR1_10920008 [Rhizophagus clarus]|uniref:D-arabinono-1,4-lactone oxidase n=1 Tax=Rhizophagus clarus TaxID=94130 RepID=A0A2Z6Q2V6_9GLOM|nr:hypothetical protein RclHR1_10920008 [Rhizophagus clarus]GES98309.1 FAD-binding protein [Rhizophagus clarus]